VGNKDGNKGGSEDDKNDNNEKSESGDTVVHIEKIPLTFIEPSGNIKLKKVIDPAPEVYVPQFEQKIPFFASSLMASAIDLFTLPFRINTSSKQIVLSGETTSSSSSSSSPSVRPPSKDIRDEYVQPQDYLNHLVPRPSMKVIGGSLGMPLCKPSTGYDPNIVDPKLRALQSLHSLFPLPQPSTSSRSAHTHPLNKRSGSVWPPYPGRGVFVGDIAPDGYSYSVGGGSGGGGGGSGGGGNSLFLSSVSSDSQAVLANRRKDEGLTVEDERNLRMQPSYAERVLLRARMIPSDADSNVGKYLSGDKDHSVDGILTNYKSRFTDSSSVNTAFYDAIAAKGTAISRRLKPSLLQSSSSSSSPSSTPTQPMSYSFLAPSLLSYLSTFPTSTSASELSSFHFTLPSSSLIREHLYAYLSPSNSSDRRITPFGRPLNLPYPYPPWCVSLPSSSSSSSSSSSFSSSSASTLQRLSSCACFFRAHSSPACSIPLSVLAETLQYNRYSGLTNFIFIFLY
jgi:hypothetical protein